jgi:hypothetical protein
MDCSQLTVYRKYGQGPQSAPPTPKPPRFLSESTEGHSPQGIIGQDQGVGSDNIGGDPPTPSPSTLLSEEEAIHQSLQHVSDLLQSWPEEPSQQEYIRTRVGDWLGQNILAGNAFQHANTTRDYLQCRLEGLMIGTLYARGGVTLKSAYRRVGVAYPDAIVGALIGAQDPRRATDQGSPPDIQGKARATAFFDRYSELRESMEAMEMMGTVDQQTQRETLGRHGPGQVHTPAAGEPKVSLLSPMSSLSDLSEPPSEIIEPAEITAKLVRSGALSIYIRTTNSSSRAPTE